MTPSKRRIGPVGTTARVLVGLALIYVSGAWGGLGWSVGVVLRAEGRAVRRVTVTVCTPDGDAEAVTFRPAPDGSGLVEDRLIRGLHPIDNQGEALLFVQLVDELYDAEITVAASGCAVDAR